MWFSPPLCVLLSTMLIVSAAAATTTPPPNIPTSDRSELISTTDESNTNLNKDIMPTEAVETSTFGTTGISDTVQTFKKNRAHDQAPTAVKNLLDVTVDSASSFSHVSGARNDHVGVLFNDNTIAQVLVQLTRHCESQSRTATDAALAKITSQLDTMQQFVGSMANQQQTLQTSVGSMANQQQTLQTSVGSIASQQQTLHTAVGLIANQQKDVLQSVAYLACLQNALQQSVGAVNQSVCALASQQQALQQSSRLLSSEQQMVIYSVDTMNKSVGSLTSDQQTLQQSIASLANQQQTLLEIVLPEIATVAAKKQTALQSVSSLVPDRQSLQVSVVALQETVSSLPGQHATLQELARSSRAEVAERLSVLEAAVSRLPGRQLGDPCRNSTDCTSFVAFSQCGTDGVCVCAADFRQAAGSNTRCQIHRLVGESCTADSDCLSAVAHSACDATGICVCATGFRQTAGSQTRCQIHRLVGDPCTADSDCLSAVAHSTCGATDVCVCATGFRQTTGSQIRCQIYRLVGESCTADSDCLSAVAHSACGATDVCACSAGHWRRSNYECRPIASLGQQCQLNNDCWQADSHTTCEVGVCRCASVRVDSYEVRLQNGGSCDRGRVELRGQSRSWGLVCDDAWDNKDADVVCRSLNYRHGTAHTNSKFGGTDNFYMDDVQCCGTEISLLDCPYSGWGRHDCNSGEVAGVTCRM